MKFTIKNLEALDPCSDALEWVKTQKTAVKAWDACERGDWLLWLLARIRPLTKQESVTLACRFALEVLQIFEKQYPDDKRPRQAIEAAQHWMNEPTDAAGSAAWSAAGSAADAARSAARSAADAAWSAAGSAARAAWSAAGSAADAARSAAGSAARAAWSAAWSAARAAWSAADAARKQQANIIREIIPNPFKSETK